MAQPARIDSMRIRTVFPLPSFVAKLRQRDA